MSVRTTSASLALLATPGLALAPQDLVFDAADHAPVVPTSSNPSQFATFGNVVLCQATDVAGVELWRLDGQGAVRVADIVPGSGSSSASSPVDLGTGTALFIASTPEFGTELWRTDGTSAGTAQVFDLVPGPSSGVSSLFTKDLVEMGGSAYFGGGGVISTQLWSSDGTAAGSKLVFDPLPASDVEYIFEIVATDTLVFVRVSFPGGMALWRTDGTPAGTFELSAPGTVHGNLTVVDDRVYFVAEAPASGMELWVSDGSLAGTTLAADMMPGPDSSNVRPLAAIQGELWFAAADPSIEGLWRLDGSGAGPQLVASIPMQSSTFSIRTVLEAAQGIVFRYFDPAGLISGLWRTDGVPGSESLLIASSELGGGDPLGAGGYVYARAADDSLWSTDGSSALIATSLVAEVPRFPDALEGTEFQGALVLRADGDQNGAEPWVAAGPALAPLADIFATPLSEDANPDRLTRLGNQLFYTTTELLITSLQPFEYELRQRAWITDGTGAGTALLLELDPDVNFGDDVASFDDLVFFETKGSFSTETQWVSDGTPAGTLPILVGEVDRAEWLGKTGERVIFGADEHSDLHSTDGTAAGTESIPGVSGSASGYGESIESVDFMGQVWFRGEFNSESAQLIVTDGTAAGTVPGITGGAPGVPRYPSGLTVVGDELFFFARDLPSFDQQLWTTDGTPNGAQLVFSFPPDASFLAMSPIAFDGALFFGLGSATLGWELWTADSAGASPVTDLNPGPGDSLLEPDENLIVRVGDLILFVGTDGTTPGLYAFDRSQGTTELVVALDAGEDEVEFSHPGSGATVLFSKKGPEGDEAWITDGTATGTHQLFDLYAGPGSSAPAHFTRLGSQVLFAADDGVHGREIFSMPFSDTGDWAAETYGWGCAGSLLPVPSIASPGPATAGATLEVTGTGALAGTLAILLVGNEDPFAIDDDCPLWSGAPFELAGVDITDGAGSATRGLLIPTAPAFVGQAFSAQWLFSDPGGELSGLGSATPGLEIVVGP